MSNKSGVADQVLSLPEGGGALDGIGEKFSPDLFTGTGNFSVPIDLPDGRNGFQPDLTLAYSTGNGNGPFGLGWKLDVPGVGRKTSDGVPVYDDSTDTFVLSGAEDLVPVPPDADGEPGPEPETGRRYRPRTEGLFARVAHHADRDTDHWVVRSKDGLVSWYGTPDERGTDPAVVADPADREQVFEWRLTRTEDPFGNRIVYEYDRDAGGAGDGDAGGDVGSSEDDRDGAASGSDGDDRDADGHHGRAWDQVYLRRVKYVDFDGEDGDPNYLVSVEFEYEDRPDAFSTRNAGFEVRTRKRCSRVVVRTHADDDGAYVEEGRPVRSYELAYADEVDGATEPLNGASLLSRVRVVGHDGADAQAMPPLEFDYSGFDPGGRDFFALEGDLPARSLANPDLELADLTGNGLPDVVGIDGTVRYWENRGDGRFAPPREMRSAPAGLELADDGVQLLDADGDGLIDLVATTNGLAGYFPLGRDGEWDRDSFQPYDVAPSFDLEDPSVQLVDLDGDGVTDAVRSGSRLECFFNDPDEGWNDVRRVPRRGMDVSFADARVKWGDLSGDGLQDVAVVYDGDVEYWPNLGHGEWGRRIAMRNSPRFPAGYDPRRVLVGDVDGDGLADVVYVDDERVLVWINRSGNAWSDPVEVDGTPPVADADAVRLVDACGTGVPGVLWTSDARGGRENAFFLDFTGGVKPYLLAEMDNRRGATTRVEYAPSTRFYLEDERRPERRWETPLPFPVQVVAKVEVIDAVSGGKQTTEYRYHHGYWDGTEREFRGFGMVEQRDTETFEEYNGPGLHGEGTDFERVGDRAQFSPPLLTKTWFHQGPVGDEFGGWEEADHSSEYWSGDPQVFARPASTEEVLEGLSRRRDRRDVFRALRGRKLRTELYALDGSSRADRPYTVTEFSYDVRMEQEPDHESSPARRGVFFPRTRGKRVTQWERGDDPMTRFTFTGRYDPYGQPRVETHVAVPRGHDYAEPLPPDSDPYLGTCTVTDYARRDDEQRYLVDRVARTTTYEVGEAARGVFALDEDVFGLARSVARAVEDDALPADAVVGQTVNFYDGAAFRGWSPGELAADPGRLEYGARVRTEELVLTEAVLRDAYEADGVASVPPYLSVDGAADWSNYPDEFRSGLPVTGGADATRPGFDLVTPVAYGFSGGDDTYARGFFAATDRRRFDFQDDSVDATRGLVVERLDPLGDDEDRKTTVEFDEPFGLLPTAVENPAGLTTRAEYDYRALRPAVVTDPNHNRTRYTYTPLGLPETVAVVGKEGEDEGDTPEQPGTTFEYDFLAFDESPPDDPQPVFVHTRKREAHRGEEFVETREYSDGFGRLVQTRTGAEDVVYGDGSDESPFGGIDLLVDQAVLVRDGGGFAPGSFGDLAGRRVGAREGSTAEALVEERLVDSEIVDGADVGTYPSEFSAVTNLESGDVDAVVADESVARRFATERDGVTLAFESGPGAVAGRELPDGAGRRVTVNGWKTYDNKGRVVEAYEPFFDAGWEYLSRREAETDGSETFGRKVTRHYDPRGRVTRMVGPDGAEQRVVHGRPGDAGLANPDDYEPTPWEAYTFDPNDNAGRTHRGPGAPDSRHAAPASDYRHHWNTPSSETVDALGRTVEAVGRNRSPAGPGGGPGTVEPHRTRSTYDARGNVLAATDPLGREVLAHTYDLRDDRLRTESVDAGVRVVVLDAAGNAVERRDSKGALVLQEYDELNRPVRLWARDDGAAPATLREYVVYGDAGLSEDAARDRNLLGERHRHYDEAGLVRFEEYDFKGNLVERERRVVRDAAVPGELPVDWQPPGTTPGDREADLLEASGYRTTLAYDALNRVTKRTYPGDQDGERKEVHPQYNRAGALQRVEIVSPSGAEGGGTYVEHVAYDATGQRAFVAYGNGVMTRYAYDPATFRLARMRSERYTNPEESTYAAVEDGGPLQDLRYEYDPAGNVTTIRDRAPESGVRDAPLGRHALDREFEYDALYRLTRATGRECEGLLANRPMGDYEPCGFHPGDGPPAVTRTNAPEHTTTYWEEYDYDPAGNLVTMRHGSADPAGRWTRHFGVGGETPAAWDRQWQSGFAAWSGSDAPTGWADPPGNRLAYATVGDEDPGTPPDHEYDANGNLVEETPSQNGRFEWDHADRLRAYREGGASGITAHYLYDSNGQRVKKVVRDDSGGVTGRETTVYVGGAFEHYRSHPDEASPPETENNTLHVMDDEKRIATVRVGDPFDFEDETLAVKYHLGDHLGSCSVVVNDAGDWVNREEYFPYGETSFGGYAKKRYRFAGKERDEESGLYYHGARYYAPWLGRWTSSDPALLDAGAVGGAGPGSASDTGPRVSFNGFQYAEANPLRFVDPDGRAAVAIAVGVVIVGSAVIGIATNPATAADPGYAPDRPSGGELILGTATTTASYATAGTGGSVKGIAASFAEEAAFHASTSAVESSSDAPGAAAVATVARATRGSVNIRSAARQGDTVSAVTGAVTTSAAIVSGADEVVSRARSQYGGGAQTSTPSGGMSGGPQMSTMSGGMSGGGPQMSTPSGGMSGGGQTSPPSGGMSGGGPQMSTPSGGTSGGAQMSTMSGGMSGGGPQMSTPSGGTSGGGSAQTSSPSGGMSGGGPQMSTPSGGTSGGPQMSTPSGGMSGGGPQMSGGGAQMSGGGPQMSTPSEPAVHSSQPRSPPASIPTSQ